MKKSSNVKYPVICLSKFLNLMITMYNAMHFNIFQEMTYIVKAIYDMMGRFTYPALKTDTTKQHVDAFFQVSL